MKRMIWTVLVTTLVVSVTDAWPTCTFWNLIHESVCKSDAIVKWPADFDARWKFENFPSEFRGAVTDAFEAWDAAAVELTITYDSLTASNRVVGIDENWTSICSNPYARAWYSWACDLNTGKLADGATIYFNFEHFPPGRYVDGRDGNVPQDKHSMYDLALHEVGHFVGLQDAASECTFDETIMRQGLENGVSIGGLQPLDVTAMEVLYSGVSAAYEGGWAFRGTDGMTVSWVSMNERGTQSFEIRGRFGDRWEVLDEVPAQGGRYAHYYEAVVAEGADAYQVAEVEEDGGHGRKSELIFVQDRAPLDLYNLRAMNATNDGRSRPTYPRSSRSQNSGPLLTKPTLPVYDYYFYSSRQDFLDAVQPVIDIYESRGFTCETILGSSNPADVQLETEQIYNRALAQGYPRLPFIFFVGSAFEDVLDPRNVVGTWYFPDDDAACYWGDCASDAKLVDADGDDIPDLPWSRIIGTEVWHIENAVRAAEYFYSGQNIMTPNAFFISGDYNAGCLLRQEPELSLEEIQGWYQSKGIGTTFRGSRDFGCSGSSYATKHAEFVNVMAGGVTEVIGTGWITSPWRFPGRFIQRMWTPKFDIADVPYPQLFVAELPGCGLAAEDLLDAYQGASIIELFMTADPDQYSTAVAWFGHKRGGYFPDHFDFARRYFANRLAVRDDAITLHDVYFQTIRELATENPDNKRYLLVAGAYGWPVQLPDMASPPPSPPHCRNCQLEAPSRADIPSDIALEAATPNPFNPETRIRYGLTGVSQVNLTIYDVGGRVVRRLLHGKVEEGGWHTAAWNGRNDRGDAVASGVYFYRLDVRGHVLTRKAVLMK